MHRLEVRCLTPEDAFHPRSSFNTLFGEHFPAASLRMALRTVQSGFRNLSFVSILKFCRILPCVTRILLRTFIRHWF